jgi:acylphosphatase
MVKTCRRYRVSGLVQGVGFRYYAQKEALRLGLAGWVCNLAGGDVDLLACGAPVRLDKFYEWLLQGPAMAGVSSVEVEALDADQDLDGFTIR